MTENSATELSQFHAIGINYRKTNAGIRGSYAISRDQYAKILELAPTYGVSECFILSTCNRTEI
ncbi:MAG TPA: glutamyl-tRNA reductase, partial [Chitinophagaceae bacterium]|nr:glutamyl-tRNA reductase [Chitinophagaceae bacterium]